MNKKLKKAINIMLVSVGIAYYFNNIYPSLDSVQKGVNKFIDEKIQEKTKIYEYNINNVHNVYDYLFLANTVVANHFKDGYSILPDKGNIEKDLARTVADCYITSNFTYSDYVYLVKHANNNDLLRDVRVASGICFGEGKWHAHRWLEYKSENQWKIFETTLFLDNKKNHESEPWSTVLLNQNLVNSDPKDYYALVYTRLNERNKLVKKNRMDKCTVRYTFYRI